MVTMKCTHGTVDWRYCNDCCHVLALEVPALKDLLSEVTRERDEAAAGRHRVECRVLDEQAARRQAERERDEAAADAARLREALESIVRVAYTGSAASTIARAALNGGG